MYAINLNQMPSYVYRLHLPAILTTFCVKKTPLAANIVRFWQGNLYAHNIIIMKRKYIVKHTFTRVSTDLSILP